LRFLQGEEGGGKDSDRGFFYREGGRRFFSRAKYFFYREGGEEDFFLGPRIFFTGRGGGDFSGPRKKEGIEREKENKG
jgi:hypothetical protein